MLWPCWPPILPEAGLLGHRRRLSLPIAGVRAVCAEEIWYFFPEFSADLSNAEHSPRDGNKPSAALLYRAFRPTESTARRILDNFAARPADAHVLVVKPARNPFFTIINCAFGNQPKSRPPTSVNQLLPHWAGFSPVTKALMSLTDIPSV